MSGVPLDPEQQLVNMSLAGQLLIHISTLPQVSHSIRFHFGIPGTYPVPGILLGNKLWTECQEQHFSPALSGSRAPVKETGAHAAPKGKP